MASARFAFTHAIIDECDRAIETHGNAPWSRHEFYGILMEEVEEAWKEIKENGNDAALFSEIIQIAAVCLRFATQEP